MSRKRSWTDEQLTIAVTQCYSYRSVIKMLGLVPAGGNYDQVRAAIQKLQLDTSHFTGQVWNKELKYQLPSTRIGLSQILVINSAYQSHKLKRRLFEEQLKQPRCELCGWAVRSKDGRIPVELDHINGNKYDNRIENLRILCPNCHSLQPTHRGKNKGVRYARVL